MRLQTIDTLNSGIDHDRSYVLPLHCARNVHARRFSSEKEVDQLSDSSVNAVTPSPRQSPAETITDKAANHSLYVVVHNTSTH